MNIKITSVLECVFLPIWLGCSLISTFKDVAATLSWRKCDDDDDGIVDDNVGGDDADNNDDGDDYVIVMTMITILVMVIYSNVQENDSFKKIMMIKDNIDNSDNCPRLTKLWDYETGSVRVCVCVRASTKNATSPLFLGRF